MIVGARSFALTGFSVAAATLFACAQGDPAGLDARVDESLRRAGRYLISKQSEDGAWRSQTYGALADGISLTPTVMKTVMLGPQSDDARVAWRRGAAYLMQWVGADGSIGGGKTLDYPVYSAALSVIVLSRLPGDETAAAVDHDAIRAARDAWLDYLRGFQLTERLGWRPDDPAFGGWGYSVRPPRKPETGRLPFEADISSTLFAVGALRLAGVPADDPAIGKALVFVKRCQNFAENDPRADRVFDDGGFFFTTSNVAQNKAGIAGRTRQGRVRFHSYGSATADGLRALLRCGESADSPRVVAARAWLERNFSTSTNPGLFEPSLAADRDAAFFYYCWSVSHAFRILGVTTIEHEEQAMAWAPALAETLLIRQRVDGSWANPHSFMKEDDPLIATSFAAAALAGGRPAAGR